MTLYNKEKYVTRAIESIINQTDKRWELIIIDDESTDNGYDIAVNYTEKYPNIKLYSMGKNYGTYVCTNLAIQLATGKYYCRLDADDELLPITVEIILNTFKKDGIDVVKYKIVGHNYGEISMAYSKNVIKKIGYYDSVRFASDTEFRTRLDKCVPRNTILRLDNVLYKVHKTPNSLTTSDKTGFRRDGRDLRNEYVKSFTNWHKKSNNLYIEFPQKERPFDVPELMITKYP